MFLLITQEIISKQDLDVYKRQEIFLAVGQHSSFTLAADALYLSQPTVSRQISLLEEELDVTLFVRGNNYCLLYTSILRHGTG